MTRYALIEMDKRCHAVRDCVGAGALLLGVFLMLGVHGGRLFAQERASSNAKTSSGTTAILEAIRTLESANDPKCHATASRL